jgi:putative (di)nucleoside polyphosphate hydrolase
MQESGSFKVKKVIDRQGFRLNVGIVLVNEAQQVLWARRIGQHDAWQFPQGGIHEQEELPEALYRELAEELGLTQTDVDIIAETKNWVSYYLPKRYRRYDSKPLCIGQKQKWYLLRLVGSEDCIELDKSAQPEFDRWQWVDFWYPIQHVIAFKRDVYQKVLREFAEVLGIED